MLKRLCVFLFLVLTAAYLVIAVTVLKMTCG